jgi:hypothetical protein
LVIGDLLSEVVNAVGPSPNLALDISQLASLSPKPSAQGSLRVIHVVIEVGLVDCESLQGLLRTDLSRFSRGLDAALQLPAERGREGAHYLDLSFCSRVR